jgi:hypothetical protein
MPRRAPAQALLAAAALALAVLLGGCASRASEVAARAVSADAYAYWDCDRLFDETDTVQQRAADVAYAVDARAGNNVIALGLGVTVFWPALLAMRPDGPEAQELATLKGRHDALVQAMARRGCGTPPQAMAQARAAKLPVQPGERLVYEDRAGGDRSPARLLGMRVVALKRDHIEFSLDLDGKPLATGWRQDLAGNVQPHDTAPPLPAWRRLLKGPLELGQVLSGELAGTDPLQRTARLRGQVVARGPQQVAGRSFNVAVVELFGDAPAPADSSTRLDGVMAVDVDSGVLLRLELRCANPEFALRRRLLRVEPAAGPGH